METSNTAGALELNEEEFTTTLPPKLCDVESYLRDYYQASIIGEDTGKVNGEDPRTIRELVHAITDLWEFSMSEKMHLYTLAADLDSRTNI